MAHEPPAERDKRLLLLHEDDNILVACVAIVAGSALACDGGRLTLAQDVALGHKLARRAMTKGDIIYKYGAPIGSATADINPGAHVHVHNLQSNYIAFYGH